MRSLWDLVSNCSICAAEVSTWELVSRFWNIGREEWKWVTRIQWRSEGRMKAEKVLRVLRVLRKTSMRKQERESGIFSLNPDSLQGRAYARTCRPTVMTGDPRDLHRETHQWNASVECDPQCGSQWPVNNLGPAITQERATGQEPPWRWANWIWNSEHLLGPSSGPKLQGEVKLSSSWQGQGAEFKPAGSHVQTGRMHRNCCIWTNWVPISKPEVGLNFSRTKSAGLLGLFTTLTGIDCWD